MNSTEISETTRRRARRKPRRRVFVMLFIFLFITTFLIAEVAVRGYLIVRGWTANCYAPQLEMFVPDPVNGATLQHDFRLRSGAFDISTNHLGFRGEDIERDKPLETTRIAVLGGSAAFGYFASDGDEAASLLEDALLNDGENVEVINAGVPGYNLFQNVHRFRTKVAPLEPDFVILYLGWNDLTYVVSDDPDSDAFQKRSLAPLWERVLGKSALYCLITYRLFQRSPNFAPKAGMNKAPTKEGAGQFRKNLKRLLDEIKECGAEPIVFAQVMAAHPDAPDDARRFLGSTDEDIEKVVALGGWLRDELNTFAGEHDLMFVDANSKIPPTTEFLGDAIHLTLKGERAVAELWKTSILEHLSSPGDTSE